MGTINLKLKGTQSDLVEKFVKSGLAADEEEAVRFAIVKSALDFGLIDQKFLVAHLRGDLKRDEKLVTDIIKEIEKSKNET